MKFNNAHFAEYSITVVLKRQFLQETWLLNCCKIIARQWPFWACKSPTFSLFCVYSTTDWTDTCHEFPTCKSMLHSLVPEPCWSKSHSRGIEKQTTEKYTLFVPLLIDIYHSHRHSSSLASLVKCRPSIPRIFSSRHAISCQVLPANIPSSTSHLYKSPSMPAPSQFFFPSTPQILSITTLKGNTATTRDWDKRNYQSE